MSKERLILLPQGYPAHPESRERCAELLLRCGGDLGRVFDGSDRRIERFAAHVAGITDVVNAREVPLVVITRLDPISEHVLKVRRLLEAEVAVLECAPWLLYADPFEDPACLELLQELGTMNGPALNAPLWTGPDSLRYLIVSPLMRAHVVRTLRDRVQLAEFGTSKRSSTRAVEAETVRGGARALLRNQDAATRVKKRQKSS